MDIKESKEIVKIIKNESLSILIIFSLLILPVILGKWIFILQGVHKLIIVIAIILLWIFALWRLRVELMIYRRKIILFNYLKKERRHTIKQLSTEWAAKKDFTEKNIDQLLLNYPDIFKRVKVQSNGEYLDGVGLVIDSVEEKITNAN